MEGIDPKALEELLTQFDALSGTVDRIRASMPAQPDDAEELSENADDATAEGEGDAEAAASGPTSKSPPPGDSSMAKKAAVAMISKRLG